MNKSDLKKIKSQEGITLLVTLILMGVLLGVSTSLLNITMKQYRLAGISYASEVAFQAANAGMECALYQDWVNHNFDVPNDGGLQSGLTLFTCMGKGSGSRIPVASEGEQLFEFSWGAPEVCTRFSVYKFSNSSIPVPVEVSGETLRADCPAGSVCTVIKSRGYNVGCGTPLTSGARVVEREYTQVY